MAVDPQIQVLLSKKNWQDERRKMRELVLDCGLAENVKWGKLCYTFNGSNVVIIYGMKNYCALGFFKGSLLADEDGLLVQPGKHSQAMRQLRFESLREIEESEDTIRCFVEKAVQAEKDGLEVAFTEKDDLDYPDELQDRLHEDSELAEALEELTPGRRRAWVLHFSDAKQPETRIRRIDKARPKIVAGKGPNER